MRRTNTSISAGLAHLRAADPVIRALIDRVGPFRVELERDAFRALVRAIVSQQISGEAAKSIFGRLLDLLGPERFTPKCLAEHSAISLRTAGISPQKASYLLDLAVKVADNQVRLDELPNLPDDAVVEQLTMVKGIGVWTAQMFLIFSLGRLDVFPCDDFGVRVALRNLYKLKALPDRSTSHKIAEPWRPFATLASWYCWRSLDLAPTDSEPKLARTSPKARIKKAIPLPPDGGEGAPG